MCIYIYNGKTPWPISVIISLLKWEVELGGLPITHACLNPALMKALPKVGFDQADQPGKTL